MVCNLQKIRLEKGLSKLALAKKSGVTRQTIIDIENGNRVNLKTDTLRKLADALDCEIGELFS